MTRYPPREGAQNVAVLCRLVATTSASKRLLEDLRELRERDRPAVISGTALSLLLDSAPGPVTAPSWTLAAPTELNEAQERALSAAMTQPLTVATGPPGTGKSQLVTALVSTAVAANQSVLVASTNNKAVDVVVQRANKLVPGLVVRTENREQSQREPEILRELLELGRSQADVATARSRLRAADRDLAEARAQFDLRAAVEGRLASLAERRDELADALGWRLPDQLVARLTGAR